MGGQAVFSQRIVHSGGALTQTINLPAALQKGSYNLILTGENYKASSLFVVK